MTILRQPLTVLLGAALVAGCAPLVSAANAPERLAGGPAAEGPVIVTAPPYPRLTLAELRARYADADSRFMTVRGIDLHYKDEGPRGAPVLLMVHGSQSTLRTWDVMVARLKDRYRIVRYDVAPFGLTGSITDAAADGIEPAAIAEDLLTALGIQKVTAVGVSSGGTLAMYLAARRPDMVERLVLSNTPSDPVKTDHLVMPQAFLDAQARQKATGFADRDFWDQYLSYFAGDPARIAPAKRAEYYDFNRRAPEAHLLEGTARIGDGVQASAEMAKVTAPTLLVWGGADPLLPKAAADAIERYLSSAPIDRVVMPDVGHYPPLEVPDRFARLMIAWIEAGVPDEAIAGKGRGAAR